MHQKILPLQIGNMGFIRCNNLHTLKLDVKSSLRVFKFVINRHILFYLLNMVYLKDKISYFHISAGIWLASFYQFTVNKLTMRREELGMHHEN